MRPLRGKLEEARKVCAYRELTEVARYLRIWNNNFIDKLGASERRDLDLHLNNVTVALALFAGGTEIATEGSVKLACEAHDAARHFIERAIEPKVADTIKPRPQIG